MLNDTYSIWLLFSLHNKKFGTRFMTCQDNTYWNSRVITINSTHIKIIRTIIKRKFL